MVQLPLPTLLFALAATCVVGSAAAQSQCGVRNWYRIANSHSGAGSELNVDTGWLTTAPLTTPGSNSNPSATCNSQGSCTPTSDYGYLRVTGTGTANNCPTSGVFLYLDQEPQARFFDTMTVTSTTLPPGTPVQVRVALALDGFATVVDPMPYVDYRATATAASLSLTLANGAGTTSGVITTAVGASVQLQGSLSTTLRCYGLLNLGIPPITSSYAVDLTARIGVSSLTAGAQLSFCSGRTYESLAASVQTVGNGCGPGSPVLSAALPVLGQSQPYAVTSNLPNELVAFAWSVGPALSAPLGPCTIAVDPGTMTLSVVGVTDPVGACSFGFFIPQAPILAGLVLATQSFVLQANGPLLGFANLSNGLEVTLGF